MKKLFEPISSAWSGVFAHKLRSFLTILGIVIGVGAVIALMSVGQGAQSSIVSSISSLGANLVTVRPSFTQSGGVRSGFGAASTLTLEDAEAISSLPYVTSVAPFKASGFQVVYGSENLRAQFIGVTTDYFTVNNLAITEGNFISSDDYTRAAKVAVIGSNVQNTLFSGSDPVGQVIRAGNYSLTVIGVLQSKGTGFTSQDDNILIPLTALNQMSGQQRTSSGGHVIQSIELTADSPTHVTEVEQEINTLLLSRHNLTSGNADFSVQSTQDIISQVSQVTTYLTLLLGAIAGISLLVGGIGVMNIMLVSVIERTREIGIRKALGAKERDIWGQFLLEAVFLTFIGGIIGVIIGWGASIIFTRFVMQAIVTANIVILAVSVSVAIGLFFGFYPAWSASRLNPIEALRHE